MSLRPVAIGWDRMDRAEGEGLILDSDACILVSIFVSAIYF